MTIVKTLNSVQKMTKQGFMAWPTPSLTSAAPQRASKIKIGTDKTNERLKTGSNITGEKFRMFV